MSRLNATALAYVRYVLKLLDVSPTALAKIAGVSATTITRPLNDPNHTHSLSMSTIMKIEDATGINFAPFADGKTEVDIAFNILKPYAHRAEKWDVQESDDSLTVQVIGDVASGNWREIDVSDFYNHAPILLRPSFCEAKYAFCLRVVGDSINKIAQQGELLFCIKRMPQSILQAGDLVIVERQSDDGRLIEQSAKRLRGSDGAWELWPESHSPRWQEPIRLPSLDNDARITIVGTVLYVIRSPSLSSDSHQSNA